MPGELVTLSDTIYWASCPSKTNVLIRRALVVDKCFGPIFENGLNELNAMETAHLCFPEIPQAPSVD